MSASTCAAVGVPRVNAWESSVPTVSKPTVARVVSAERVKREKTEGMGDNRDEEKRRNKVKECREVIEASLNTLSLKIKSHD